MPLLTTLASSSEAFFAKSAIMFPAATVHLLVLFSAGSLLSLTSPVMLKSATCVHLSFRARAQGHRLYSLISISRRQAGFLHLTHTPRELAARSAQTGKGFPQQGQGTGIRSAAEACEERGIMFGNGLGNGGTPSQGGRQGKALLQVGIVVTHGAFVFRKIHGAPAHDLRHEGILRQSGEQRPEAEPMQLFAGQVDAVGLLERRHDVRRVAPVVERGAFVRAARGSACRRFCGLFSGAVKLDEPAVFFLQVGG
nr:MAG TPA: hypothetical protein [Caudoviricetes sp.]